MLSPEDTAKLEIVPPVALISPARKPETASEKVKVTVAVSPALRLALSEVIARVGSLVSTDSAKLAPTPLPAAAFV